MAGKLVVVGDDDIIENIIVGNPGFAIEGKAVHPYVDGADRGGKWNNGRPTPPPPAAAAANPVQAARGRDPVFRSIVRFLASKHALTEDEVVAELEILLD